jgi:hypothetical protein
MKKNAKLFDSHVVNKKKLERIGKLPNFIRIRTPIICIIWNDRYDKTYNLRKRP